MRFPAIAVAFVALCLTSLLHGQQGYHVPPAKATIVESQQAPPVTPAMEKPTTAPALDKAVEASGGLHKVVIEAGIKAQRSGDITRLQLFRLRVAMLSPAFRDRVEDLAVVQIMASNEANIPLTVAEDGTIDRTAINWDELITFIERLLPLILQLIALFGG